MDIITQATRYVCQAHHAGRRCSLQESQAGETQKVLEDGFASGILGKGPEAGLAYSGLGQHDKGVAPIQQGIARGGLRRKDDAKLHLGIALHRAGHKQRAAQVLRTVGGTDGTADLARLWMKVP